MDELGNRYRKNTDSNGKCEISKERIRRAGKQIKEESPLTAQKINIYEQFKQLMDWADDEAFKNIKVI